MFFLIRTVGRGSRGRTGQGGGGSSWLKLWALCFMLAIPIAAVGAAFHALSGPHKPPQTYPFLVTFTDGGYDGYGTPSFEVSADNGNAAAVTVRKVTVEFVNDQTGQEICSVTERVGATVIPGGQTQTLSGAAPAAVANTAAEDRQIGVTVTGWS
jgi:hypothetical protein